MSRATSSMAGSTPTPTTTYPFTYTTYSTSLPSTSFSRPTIIPTGIFSFGPGLSCSANSMASAKPSNFPMDNPLGLKPACVISNAREVNDHAFWDLYECCKGKDMSAGGSPNACTAQCVAENGQTWQELGECLSKRVEVVVCSPQFIEIGRNETEGSAIRSSILAKQSTSSGAGSTTGSSTQTSPSTGAGSTVTVARFTSSKAGAVLFVVLAVGSFAGMML